MVLSYNFAIFDTAAVKSHHIFGALQIGDSLVVVQASFKYFLHNISSTFHLGSFLCSLYFWINMQNTSSSRVLLHSQAFNIKELSIIFAQASSIIFFVLPFFALTFLYIRWDNSHQISQLVSTFPPREKEHLILSSTYWTHKTHKSANKSGCTIADHQYNHQDTKLKKQITNIITRMGRTIRQAQKLNLGRIQSLQRSPTVFKKTIFRMLGETDYNIIRYPLSDYNIIRLCLRKPNSECSVRPIIILSVIQL